LKGVIKAVIEYWTIDNNKYLTSISSQRINIQLNEIAPGRSHASEAL